MIAATFTKSRAKIFKKPASADLAAGISAFVETRRKETGGYGATPTLPATVEDTYQALRILSTLKGRGEHDFLHVQELKHYLSRVKKAEWLGARTTFHLLSSCILAGVPIDIETTTTFVEKRLAENQARDERYYCARIVREVLNLPTDAAQEQFASLYEATPLKWRVASELWMILYQLQGRPECQAEAPINDLVAWLQACQNYDGGFGFLPHSTSYIDNCYTCLRALSLLGAAPRDPEACRAFVLACETGVGGFARISKATAFLSSTWHAVAAISLLDSMA